MNLSRKTRYSFRALFAMTTVAAISLGWQVDRAHRLRRTMDAIGPVCTAVFYDYQERGLRQPPGPKWLRSTIGDEYFTDVVEISLEINDSTILRGGFLEDSLVHLGELPNLRGLRITGAFTDESMLYISKLANLEVLIIAQCDITAQGLQELGRCTKLREIVIWSSFIDDEDLRSLSSLSQLRYVSLWGTGITNQGLDILSAIPDLESLSLVQNERITGEGFRALRKAKNILLLDISDSGLTDAALRDLATLPRLERLSIEQSEVSNEGLQELKQLKSLRKLWVTECDRLSPNDVSELDSAMPDCEVYIY